ncbi:MAG: excinuclease ABC subunit UvrA [Candidatus Aenigmarchaeota archaeon]|nr:excinuclease ABC subunit UvrA [Candidatus Aenigmarchaeota archaeon]
MDKIVVRGAREHNLKNINVEIPRNKLVVITGMSGSGKSTLAFDTIYAEGQRRYVESLSAYARQFLGLMNKPDIDLIDGLSPAISIEQKTTSKNPRSTVGTVTEIYDYLRLLFARIGTIHCPKCKSQIRPQSVENIVNLVMSEKKEIIILAPLISGVKGTHEKIFEGMLSDGFSRVRIDGEICRLDEIKDSMKLARYEKHWIEAVVDRLDASDDNRSRISEDVEQAVHAGKGTVIILDPAKMQKKTKEIQRGAGETIYSTFGACPRHPEVLFQQLEPRMFSFNSPFGACTGCLGLGETLEISQDLLIPDKSKSMIDGAIAVYGRMDLQWRCQQIAVVGKKFGFDIFTPLSAFSKKQLDVLLNGTTERIDGRWSNGASMNMENGWEGIIPQTLRLYKQTESDERKEDLERFMIGKLCRVCEGKRLKETVLSVSIAGKSIIDITEMDLDACAKFFMHLAESLSEKDKIISKQILKEIDDRISFLTNVGLGYLSLSRSSKTLSGGEAQRIRLATQIGSNLMGVLYILDEPSIGLHQRDNNKLIATLQRLRDIGNTLIVVEHDYDTIKAADYIIDMGPGAGVHGGHVASQGTPDDIAKDKNSITGRYLSGHAKIDIPEHRREPKGFIVVKGASENNLKNISISLPTGVLCGITGVSGSGKSTLINQTLVPLLKKHSGMIAEKIGKNNGIEIPKSVKNVIVIDQDPIGKTPRSNPATYTKIFDEIRKIFSFTKEARARGYKEGRFSFNVKGGRCESCKGDGVIKIEMNFLPDVYVQCEDCKGKRYNKETLAITYKEKNIADVLDMSVEDATKFFENHTGISRKIKTLYDVGLGYIKLGQSSNTLSGGEAQRIKLTRELSKQKTGDTIYMLDEPTTGLHFEDVRKLIMVLNRLVEKGSSVLVIEHNLDIVKSCDYLIDMGPEGGRGGGRIIAMGTPEEVAMEPASYTGQFLKRML